MSKARTAPPLDLENNKSWSALPPELQSQILGKLSFRERIRARLVCRDWQLLLDTRLLWTQVRRLTLKLGRVWIWEGRDGEQPLTESNVSPLLAFRRALEFLAPRSPLASLEILLPGPGDEQMLASSDFYSELAELLLPMASALKLRSLAATDVDDWPGLRRLIQSLPYLETLTLAALESSGAEVAGAIAGLQSLRVLVLELSIAEMAAFPASFLAQLDCLVLHFDAPLLMRTEEKLLEKAWAQAGFEHIRASAPQLQHRVYKSKAVKDSGGFVFTRTSIRWARPDFDAQMVMSDKSRYSCNFVLDMNSY